MPSNLNNQVNMSRKNTKQNKNKNISKKRVAAGKKGVAGFKGLITRKKLATKKRKEGINLTSNRLKKMRNIKIDINSDTFTTLTEGTIKLISGIGYTASKSMTFRITDTTGKMYILKIHINNTTDKSIPFETEKENYKTMKKILKNRLTPHIYTYIDSKVENFKLIDETNKLYKFFKNQNSKKPIETLCFLLIETTDSKTINYYNNNNNNELNTRNRSIIKIYCLVNTLI